MAEIVIRETEIDGVYLSKDGDAFVIRHPRNYGYGKVISRDGKMIQLAGLYLSTWGCDDVKAKPVEYTMPRKYYKKRASGKAAEDETTVPLSPEYEQIHSLFMEDNMTVASVAQMLRLPEEELKKKIHQINAVIQRRGLRLKLIPGMREQNKESDLFLTEIRDYPFEFRHTLTSKQQRLLNAYRGDDVQAAFQLGLSSPLSVYQMRRRIHDRYVKWLAEQPR